MRSKGSGTIFFMGSISGWHGIPGGGPYSASKFALEGTAPRQTPFPLLNGN